MASKYGTFEFRYDVTAYQPQAIKNMVITEKEARAEYTRLRKVIQSRAKSFERAGLTDNETYRDIVNMPRLSELKNRRELGKAMKDARRIIEQKKTTVRGYKEVRRKITNRLNEIGYDFITEKNVESFGRFMEWFRKTREETLYDSMRVAEVYNSAVGHNASIEEVKKKFEYYYNNIEDADKIFPAKK